MAQNDWRLLTFAADYTHYSYWIWTTSCNALAAYENAISGKSADTVRLSTQIQVNLFNAYSFYGLTIPHKQKNKFRCTNNEYKDPTSWLFKIGNEFFGNYFRILYANWTAYVYYFGKELHQPYSEILNMPMYELLLLFDYFQEDVKNQNKETEEKQISMESEMKNMRNSISNIQSANLNNPKMPDMGNFKIPNFNG